MTEDENKDHISKEDENKDHISKIVVENLIKIILSIKSGQEQAKENKI